MNVLIAIWSGYNQAISIPAFEQRQKATIAAILITSNQFRPAFG